jgi:hypothetical protein
MNNMKQLLFYLNISVLLSGNSFADVYFDEHILIEKQSVQNAYSICMADIDRDGFDLIKVVVPIAS